MMPRCELCGQDDATTFAYLADDVSASEKGKWVYCCDCTRHRECYYLDICDYLGRPQYWLEHMRDKSWWNEGAFSEMLSRYKNVQGKHDGGGA